MSQRFIEQLEKFKEVSPSAAWKERTRDFILRSKEEEKSIIQSWRQFFVRPAFVMPMLITLLFSGSFGIVSASKNALPGSLLYSVKLTTEKMKRIATSKEKQIEFEFALLSTRLNELTELSEKEHVSAIEVKRAIRQYSVNIDSLQEELAIHQTKDALQIAERVQKTKGEFEHVLQQTAQKVDLTEDKELIEDVKKVKEQTIIMKKNALAIVVKDFKNAKTQQEEAKEFIEEELEETQQQLDDIQEQLDENVALASVVDQKEEVEEADPQEILDGIEEQLSEVKVLLDDEEELPQALTKLEETQAVLDEIEEQNPFASVEPFSDEIVEELKDNTEIVEEDQNSEVDEGEENQEIQQEQ